MTTTRLDYLARLNRIIDYIHIHLDDPLTLQTLAAEAGFSPFHFHRIFKALVGETLSAYIQRARLERAANLLRLQDQGILEIGLACGFNNPPAFARAFRARFGLSPSQYRRQNRKPGILEGNLGTDRPPAPGYNESRDILPSPPTRSDLPMNVEVKTLPSFHVACIRHLSGYQKGINNPQIGRAFDCLAKWAAARKLLGPGTLFLGIPYDDPDVTPTDRCRYDACLTIPASVTVGSGEVSIHELPGGECAVVHIEVAATETHRIGEAVDSLYGEWLPASGYTAADRPPLEIYYPPDPARPEGWIVMDFCVPVQPA